MMFIARYTQLANLTHLRHQISSLAQYLLQFVLHKHELCFSFKPSEVSAAVLVLCLSIMVSERLSAKITGKECVKIP